MSFIRKVQLPSGTVAFRAVWLEGGKKRSKNFERERDARRHAALMADQTGRLGIIDVERMSFGQYAERHISNLESLGQCSPTTLVGLSYAVARAAPYIGRKRLGEIGPLHLDSLFAALLKGSDGKKALAASTVATVKRNISSIMSAARKQRLIPSNPCSDTAPVGSGRGNKPRHFTVDELRKLIAAADAAESSSTIPGIGTLVRFFVFTGSRRGEALGLRWSRVDLDSGLVTIDTVAVSAKGRPILRERTKTKASTRTISIPGDLCERLRLHRLDQKRARLQWGKEWQNSDLVFCGPSGGLLWPGKVTYTLTRIMKSAGLSGRQPVHGYRHSAATLLLASNEIDVVAVSKRLGHSAVSITLNVYGSTDAERDRRASGILDSQIGR